MLHSAEYMNSEPNEIIHTIVSTNSIPQPQFLTYTLPPTSSLQLIDMSNYNNLLLSLQNVQNLTTYSPTNTNSEKVTPMELSNFEEIKQSTSEPTTPRSSPEYNSERHNSSSPSETTSQSAFDDTPRRKNLGTLSAEEKREYRRAQNRIDQRRRAEKVKSRADSLRNRARQKQKQIENKIQQLEQHKDSLNKYLKEIPSIQEKNNLIFKELSSTTAIKKSEKAAFMEYNGKIDAIVERVCAIEKNEVNTSFSDNYDEIASEISFTPARYVKTDELMKMPAWKRCRVRRQMEEQKLENACDQLDKKLEKIEKVNQSYEDKIYFLLKESVFGLRQITASIVRLRDKAQIAETRAKTLAYDLSDMTRTIDNLENDAQLRDSKKPIVDRIPIF